jgi:predicted transcriptional regulator
MSDIDSQVGHPQADVLIMLSKFESGLNPVYLHKQLGLSYRVIYSVLSILTDAGLVAYRRFKYHLTEKGREILLSNNRS